MTQDTEGSVTLAVNNGIATIEFEHPKGNSLPGAILRRLAATIDEAGSRSDAAVVILGSGGSGPFCAGASFDELRAIDSAETGKEFFSGFAHVILAMKRCPRLVVTRVHGKVVGGGVGIVAASDYAIATEAAKVRLSELAVGIGPFVVGPAIERRIGRAHFAAMAIDFDWRSAEWAASCGLYSQLVPPRSLDESVHSMATRLAAANPAATAALKRVLWEGTDDWPTLLQERAAISGQLVLSEYTRQAIERFAQKS